jgi:hypothetical protein
MNNGSGRKGLRFTRKGLLLIRGHWFISIGLGLSAICAIQGRAFALCPLSQTDPSVTVCTPIPNSVVSSRTHVVAGTTDSHPVVAVQIYVDSVLVYKVNATSVDTYVKLSVGNHLLTVQGWDNTGATFKKMSAWR